MKVHELTGMTTPELEHKLDDAYRELFNLHFQRTQGQLTDTNSIKRVRHDIARLKTILRQRELAVAMVATETQKAQAEATK